MDEAFVERIFNCEGQPLVCRWFMPERRDYVTEEGLSGEEYHCRWSIAWPWREESRTSIGIDGVQALILAMRTVATQLDESDVYRSGKLTYLDEQNLMLPPVWGSFPSERA